MSNFKIATVVQARMSSTRLPFKVMMSLAGKPLIYRQIERINSSILSGTIVVATSNEESDDDLANYCISEGINVYRGSLNDLLDRHYHAAKSVNANIVIKIPSDCPLIDPNVINKVVKYYLNNQEKFDFVSNLHPATYPDGNDVEIMSISALETALNFAQKDYEREHTTPFFWENPERFRIGNIEWETGFNYSMSHRWTIDYEEDYLFIKRVYDELYNPNYPFTLYDILNLLDRKPDIKLINKKFAGVNWYRNHLGELKTISKNQTKAV